MNIAIDMDQVLCDWVGCVLDWYNEDKGTSFTREDCTEWDMQKNLGSDGRDFIRSVMRYPEFYRDLAPIEGALAGLKKLVELDHDVIIVTAVPRCAGIAYHGKLEWLRRNAPFFDLRDFYSAERKWRLNFDILLDDGPHNIEEAIAHGKLAVIFDAPWNRNMGSHIPRVKHWNEFLEKIDGFVDPF